MKLMDEEIISALELRFGIEIPKLVELETGKDVPLWALIMTAYEMGRRE